MKYLDSTHCSITPGKYRETFFDPIEQDRQRNRVITIRKGVDGLYTIADFTSIPLNQNYASWLIRGDNFMYVPRTLDPQRKLRPASLKAIITGPADQD